MYYYIKSLKNYNLLGISINKSISSFVINNICVYIDDNILIQKNRLMLKTLFDYADLSYFDINLNISSNKKHIQTKFGDIYKHISINPDLIRNPDINYITNLINNINKNCQVLIITSIDNLDCKYLIENINNHKTKIHFMNINFDNKFIDYFVLNYEIEFFIASHMEEIIEYFFTNLSKTYIKINYLDRRLTIKAPEYIDISKKETFIGILLDKSDSEKLLVNNNRIKITINSSVYNIVKKPTELTLDKRIIFILLGLLNICTSIKRPNFHELNKIIDLYITTYNCFIVAKINEKSKNQIKKLFDDSYYTINVLTEAFRNYNITKFNYNTNKNIIIDKILYYEELIDYRDSLYIKKTKPHSLALQKQVIYNIDTNNLLKLKDNVNKYISNYRLPNKNIIDNETFYCSIINQSSFHEEIKNGDILGILVNISYDNSTSSLSLENIIIKDISLSFIFFSEMLKAQEHYYNKFYYFDDGTYENNNAISGDGLGRGNAIIPLYIDKTHFNLVKLLYKNVIGFTINQDLFSFHKNYYLIPLLVFSKYNILLFTEYNLNDRAIKIWLDLYKTCKELYFEYVQQYKFHLAPYTNLHKLITDDKRIDIIINKYSSHTIFMIYILLINYSNYDLIKLHLKTIKLYSPKHTSEYIFNFIRIYDIIYNTITNKKDFNHINIQELKSYLNDQYIDINKYGNNIDDFLKNKYNYVNHN